MRQILHTYKLRLTNLSQANRSLKLGRLSKRRDIDMCDLGHLNGLSADELLLRLLADKDLSLISRPDPRHEPTNIADRRLNYIYREVNTLFEEVGSYDLFVGYPFVEGKFSDGTIARCPVLLFPVRLERKLSGRPRWKLERLKDEPVTFNKTFFLAYEQFQHIRLPEAFWEEEIETQPDKLTWVNALYEKVKQYELEVNFNPRLFDQSLQAFPDYLKATMENFKVGTLSFQPHAVLGIFPQSDSALLQDYETLESDPNGFALDQFFGENAADSTKPGPGTHIKEEDRYFVTPVDQSQEAALLNVKAGQSLVIHGPPGTGKSQVIVNMIADAMAHGKRVLLVSQKRAALDVVHKRLEGLGLGQFSVLVHDFRHDRKLIYEQIRETIEAIETFKQEILDLNVTQWEYTYQILSRQVDQFSRKYEELYQALSQPQACGMSTHELYLQTDRHQDMIPLKKWAPGWTLAELGELLDILPLLYPYREFFQDLYPWYHRKSLKDAGWNERTAWAEQLGQVEAQLGALHRGYQALRQHWDFWPLTHIEENARLIQAYRKVDAQLADPFTVKELETLMPDPTPEAIPGVLDEFEACLQELATCVYLDAGHWRVYGSLKKHLSVYRQQHDKSLRYISLPYQRARWFLKKLLATRNTELSLDSFKKLEQEGKRFAKLHRVFAREHEREFLGDFPLLNAREEKYTWLTQKRSVWHLWRHAQELKEDTKLKRPRLTGGILDREAWQMSIQQIDQLESYTHNLGETAKAWSSVLHNRQIEPLWSAISAPERVSGYIEELKETFDRDGEELHNLDRLIGECHQSVQESLYTIFPWVQQKDDPVALQQQVRNSVYAQWIIQAERVHPVLGWVSTRSWPEQARLFRDKLAESRKRVVELVLRRVKERIIDRIEYNRLKNPVTYRDILHQVSKKRRIWSIRKLVQETWEEGLAELTPCWMASPESASAIFPMKAAYFDLVIFDEASQCFVERAIPVMLRGKRAVIAGDDKQLQPLNLYQVRYEEEEGEYVEDEVALEVESILDLAKTRLAQSPLNWHYRSQQAALINFSNIAFYGGKLQVFPPARQDRLNQPPLEWIQVEGLWHNNRNEVEAQRVIQLVLELIQRPDFPTLGIVTFNYHQQELIKDKLEDTLARLVTEDEAQYQQLLQCMERREQGEYQGLFVKNIENVQGDERDIILFSVGYAHNFKGTMNTRFGLLNQAGGENRLNVAVTRARKKIYVVCSFRPEELSVESAVHDGPKLFKAYLQYVYSISQGHPPALPPGAIAPSTSTSHPGASADPNKIAAYLAERLQAESYHVERDVGDTGYKLDLAVKASASSPTYLLGIECEGPYYFRGASAREREIYRLEGLRYRGWHIHRVWARNFWWDKEAEVQKVLEKLKKENGEWKMEN